MATTTCPNCGKPLRPGAKFCGNCGTTLPAAAPRAAAPASPPGAACPHCGKPVRIGAKFCSHCGQVIEGDRGALPLPADNQTAVGSAVPGSTLPGTVPGSSTAGPSAAPPIGQPRRGESGEHPAQPARAPAPPVPGGARRSRRGLILGLTAGLLVACGLVIGGGWMVANRMGWINLGATETTGPSATAVITATLPLPTTPVVTATLAATSTFTAIPTQTVTATLTVTNPTGIPTSTITLEVTPTFTQSLGIQPFLSTTPAVGGMSVGPQVVLEDTFDGALSDNWRTWGDRRPRIDSGPGDRWLYLIAEDPGSAGVTSRRGLVIYNAPGVVIEFEGQLDANYPRSVMLWDWDPDKTVRGPDYRDPGLVRLMIVGEQLSLQTPLTGEDCRAPINAFQKHTYIIRFIQGQGVTLTVDENPETVCNIPFLGLAPVPGWFSFSGMGWVTRVRVMQSPTP